MSRWSRWAGVMLAGVAVAALWGAVRLTRVQIDYFHLKYGRHAGQSARQIEPLSEAVWRRYPAHYYLSLQQATGWWTLAMQQGQDDPDPAALAAARRWVQRGLDAHPLLSDLRLLEARLLAIDDPRAAVVAWDAYVDRHYWNAFNQAMRLDFYVQAEAFTEASGILALLRNRPHHDWARNRFRSALQASMRPPTHP